MYTNAADLCLCVREWVCVRVWGLCVCVCAFGGSVEVVCVFVCFEGGWRLCVCARGVVYVCGDIVCVCACVF